MSALDRVLWLVQFPGMDLQYSAPPLITAWASVIFFPAVVTAVNTCLVSLSDTVIDSGAARFSPGI